MIQHSYSTLKSIIALTSALVLLGFGSASAQTPGNAADQTSVSDNPGMAVLQTRQIASGSSVKIQMLQSVNSGTAHIGDRVRAQVAADDTSGLPSGTVFVGRVTDVQPATSKFAGILNIQFGIPSRNRSGQGENSYSYGDVHTAMAFPDAAAAHLTGQAPRSDKSNYASIGAGAGALLGLSRKRKLGDAVAGAILGGAGGYAADQAQKRPGGDVDLPQGKELSINLKTPLTLRTEIVAPY